MAHVAHEIEWADSGDIGQEEAKKYYDAVNIEYRLMPCEPQFFDKEIENLERE